MSVPDRSAKPASALDTAGLEELAGTFAEERQAKVISRAVGEELRRAREACNLSRAELAARLPSGIGERTLLSYEHGSRHLTFLRFLEICWVLGVDAPSLARQALQRARIQLRNLTIRVDLHALIRNQNETYRPVAQWARNTLNEHPDGYVEVEPIVIKHLAYSFGCDHNGLINHLARFIPDDPESTDTRP